MAVRRTPGTASRELVLRGSAAVGWLSDRDIEVIRRDAGSVAVPEFVLSTDELVAPGFRLARIWHTAVSLRISPTGPPPFVRVVLKELGEASLSEEAVGERTQVSVGDVAILTSGHDYTWITRAPTAWYEIELHLTVLEALAAPGATVGNLFRDPAPGYRSALVAIANAALNSTMAPSDTGFAAYVAAVRSLLVAMFLQVQSDALSRSTQSERLYLRAIAVIQERASDSSFSVATLATEMSLSTRRVHAAFAEQGTTPGEALREKRVEAAQNYLSSLSDGRTADLGKVAALAGFPSVRAMRRVFSSQRRPLDP